MVKCKRKGCSRDAEMNRVYCSKECAPLGRFLETKVLTTKEREINERDGIKVTGFHKAKKDLYR